VTITSIKQQIKNPERVSIFVDERYSFSLTLDEVIKYKIKKDLRLTEGDVKKFKMLSEDGKLRARSLEWLLNRPHSTREFRDYLYKKKAEADLTDKLIEEFAQKGYLDDAKFAAWFIELRQRKNRSPRAIRAELMQKGISGELLNDAMSSDQINEREALKDLIAKKKNLSKYKNDPQKLKQYLASRGFGYDIINETLKDT